MILNNSPQLVYDLKVGDICYSYKAITHSNISIKHLHPSLITHNDIIEESKVIRVTATQLTISGGTRFFRNTGGSFAKHSSDYLVLPTPQLHLFIKEHNNRVRMLRRVKSHLIDIDKFSLGKLLRVYDILSRCD
jgi:hypothetical protein